MKGESILRARHVQGRSLDSLPTTQTQVAAKLHSLEAKAKALLEEIARHASDRLVTLVAVSKTVGPDAIRQAHSAGLRDFGENRIPSLEEKLDALADLPDLRWHFIGHLQRNKVRKVLGRVSLIHSVDSLRLLQAIDKEALRQGIVQDVLLQFNTSGEESKHGFDPSAGNDILRDIESCKGVRVRGLMTMAPFVDDEEVLRNCFASLRKLGEELRRKSAAHIDAERKPLFDGEELSMGMSNDYQFALSEGATMLRIGTAIFGRAR